MILSDEADARCLVPTLIVLGTESKVIARFVGKHTKPETLRPAVAVDEGMASVYLVDIPRRLGSEVFLAPPDKIAVTRKLREQVFHPRLDISWHRKRHSSPAGRVVPFAPRPCVEVLEKMAVYRLEARVGSMMGANWKPFVGAVLRYLSLCFLKNFEVTDAELVNVDFAIRIERLAKGYAFIGVSKITHAPPILGL